jgi:hypothetical protein
MPGWIFHRASLKTFDAFAHAIGEFSIKLFDGKFGSIVSDVYVIAATTSTAHLRGTAGAFVFIY